MSELKQLNEGSRTLLETDNSLACVFFLILALALAFFVFGLVGIKVRSIMWNVIGYFT